MAPLRWGICSTGGISTKFSLDLLIPPATRQVTDVSHVIAAVGSRTRESAQSFVENIYRQAGSGKGKDDIATYGNYSDLFNDPNVDCIYIGTPHSHHYANAHAALSAGKSVVCEKSLTVNAAQAQELVDLARSKKVFFMEAVWTRFQPVSYKVQELIKSKVIGDLVSVQADLSINFDPENQDPGHRMINPELAGGALLDLGPYPWVWLAMTLLPFPTQASEKPYPVPKIAATMSKTKSGLDAVSTAVIEFPQEDGRILLGTLSCSMLHQSAHERVVQINGTKGYIQIDWATFRPEKVSYHVSPTDENVSDPLSNGKPKSETFMFDKRPGNIWGFAWEADEAARCIQKGKIESDRMPLRDSILQMQVFDEIRKQGQLTYPESIETLDVTKSNT